MIKKLIRSNLLKSQLRKKKKTKPTQTTPTPTQTEPQQPQPTTPQSQPLSTQKKPIDYNSTFIFDFVQKGGNVEDVVDFTYRKYPTHISHWNPESNEYVQAPREEKRMADAIIDHNNMLDQFKKDLKLQQQVLESIQNLDRPYLRDGVRGETRNVYDEVKDYRVDKVEEKSQIEAYDTMYENYTNEKMIINNTPFPVKLPKMSNELEHEKMLEEMPVNPNYHPDKGYKFDVETPYDQRYPHVADRLGHPEIFLKPVESLLRIENDVAHPGNLDQPFIQTPKAEPTEDLDFTAGEVIYEHPKVYDWVATGQQFMFMGSLYFSSIFPAMTMFGTTTPLGFIYEDTPFPLQMMSYGDFDVYGFLPMFYISIMGTIVYSVNVG